MREANCYVWESPNLLLRIDPDSGNYDGKFPIPGYPISTKGSRLCPPNNTGIPGFAELPTVLNSLLLF